MARTLVLLLALALLLGLTWFLTRGGEGEPSEIERHGIGEQVGPAMPTESDSVPGIDGAPEQRAPIPAAAESGTLEVLLLDRSGTPLTDVPVELEVRARDGETGAMEILAEGRTEEGTCRLEGLAADTPLVVVARAEPPWLPGRLRIDPPIDFTEPVEVVLGFDGLILVGLALGPDREPLASTELSPTVAAEVGGLAGWTSDLPLTSDEEGRFVWRCAGGLHGHAVRHWHEKPPSSGGRYLVELSHRSAGEWLSSGWIEPRIGPEVEVHDLGEVQLEPPPVLAAGRVVDGEGRPLADAQVWIRAPWQSETWQSLPPPPETSGRMFPYGDAQGAVTDTDGAFRIRGRPPETAIEIGACHEVHLQSTPLPCAPGDRNLLVVLEAAALLEGSFRDLTPQERGSIYLSMSEPGGEFATVWTDSVHDAGEGARFQRNRPYTSNPGGPLIFRLRDDGTFGFGPIPPGLYTVHAYFWGDEPFLEVADLELLPGETNRDPRLQDLVLAELLAQVELEVVDDTGRRVTEGYVLVGDGEGISSLVDLRSDPLVLRGEALPLDLVIRAAGFSEVVLEDVWEDREVVLEPGWPVRFQLPAATRVPEGWTLRIGWDEDRMDLDQAYGFGDLPGLAEFDAAGSAELVAPRPGRLPVSLTATRRLERTSDWATLNLPGRENWVEVRDLAGTQLIELPLTAQQLKGLPD